MLASPMDTPVVKIVVSNAPPFFPNDVLLSVLCSNGTVVSRMSMIPLRSGDVSIKHVMSLHRQVYMVLPDCGGDMELNISFKVNLSDREYQMYVSLASLKRAFSVEPLVM